MRVWGQGLLAGLGVWSSMALAQVPAELLLADEERFISANAEFTLLHEMGHLLIHELQLPVLGREEDAADHLGLMGLFLLHGEHRREDLYLQLIDVADYWSLESSYAKERDQAIQAWDSHAMDDQRFYNIACLIYGSDPQNLDWVLEVTGLPDERSFYCDEEYRQVEHAVTWLSEHFRARSAEQGHRIQVEYGPLPVQLEGGEALLARIQASGLIEQVANRASDSFPLPRPVSLRLVTCGAPDAWYNRLQGELNLCYELIEHFRVLAAELPALRARRLQAHGQ